MPSSDSEDDEDGDAGEETASEEIYDHEREGD